MPGKLESELHTVAEALRTTGDVLRAVTAVAAAGEQVEPTLAQLVREIHTAATYTRATLDHATPRTILERAFADCPTDDHWRQTILPAAANRGRQILTGR